MNLSSIEEFIKQFVTKDRAYHETYSLRVDFHYILDFILL